ncbi:Serine/threonine-protein kinase PrkC [Stieleria maiorica]|uniref:non-specific serine/threonine protein kinase n=1 Tax=Stieleria maiorica TaxID=2795974 RepID=A0A5B9MG59_9BACT|nr:serine/threonine-protein kinase [Stieleria maiorica]QEG00253.1 Serine/threonine-protein kinase PrkC [Stieleria maiorica]
MSPHFDVCGSNRIEAYLQNRLSAVEESAFESHLENCSWCRQRLEECAAAPSCWHEARDLLTESSWRDHSQPIRNVLEILAPTDQPDMLGRLGTYEISGVVGYGGMGVVLKGFDPSLKRVVAIKVLAPHLATSGASRQRFARECQAAAAVTHDNIIEIYGVAEANGLPYLVMPYVRGPSLQSRIDRQGALPVEEVLRIGHQIAAGLAAAHAQGLVHRDIKPANILLSDGTDRLVITDFGLARAVDDASVTKTGVIAGTPQYMSPEQARGELIEQRSDLFSLGSVLYTLCTGRPPFRANTTYGVLQQISDQTPRNIRDLNPAIPEWLCQIIRQLHRKCPNDRYESADQVARRLEQCLAHVQQPHVHLLPETIPQSRRSVAWSHMPLWLRTFTVLVALGLIGVTMWCLPRTQTIATDPISPATMAPTDASDRLCYQMQSDQEHAFLITIYSELPDVDTQVDGLVVTKVLATDDADYHLRIESDLQLTETFDRHDDRIVNDVGMRHYGNHYRRWSGRRTGHAVLRKTGELISQQGNLELPFALASLPELILPVLPVESKVGLPGTKDRFRIDSEVPKAPIHSDSRIVRFVSGDAQVDFDAAAGMIDSVRFDRTITLVSDNTVQRVPIHAEVIRITSAERLAWESGRGDVGHTPSRETVPLTSDQEDRLLADLQNDRRLLYWLHDLNRRPVASFSSDVADAIAVLSRHPNGSFRTIAQRLVDKMPPEQLNPFRQVE